METQQRAITEYRRILDHQPHLIEVRLQLGKMLQQVSREAEAIQIYEQALMWVSDRATQHYVEGLINLCRRSTRRAIQSFEAAIALEPNNVEYGISLGQAYLNLESPVTAAQALDQVLRRAPHDITVLTLSYDACLAMGQFQEAQQHIDLALALAPNDFRVLKRLASDRCRRSLVVGEAGKETLQLIQRAQQFATDETEAHQLLANYHLSRGEWAKGLSILEALTQQIPSRFESWYFFAKGLFRAGDYQTAARAILKAYRLYPGNYDVYHALCEILPAAGKSNELHPLLEEMLRFFPECWSVWTTVGRVMVEHLENSTLGCAIAEKATQTQPQLAEAWFLRGQVLLLAGQHLEAIAALEEGWHHLTKGSKTSQALPATLWLGTSYQALGEALRGQLWLEEAYRRAEALVKFSPAIAHYWQGKALDAMGDRDRASQIYHCALSYHLPYPAHAEVLSTQFSEHQI